MGQDTKANDWHVCPFVALSGGAAISAGYWTFFFQSDTAQVRNCFRFAGIGIGAGYHAPFHRLALATLPVEVPVIHWKHIECDEAFSADDLSGAAGRITAAGAAIGGGYHLLYISAFGLSGGYFSSQGVHGFHVGMEIGALSTVGQWKMIEVGEYSKLEEHH